MGDTTAKRPLIAYVLFDMDGLLLDTERVYTEVTNAILGEYGKEMTWGIKSELMGKPERESAQHLLSHFPDIPLTVDSFIAQKHILQYAAWPTVQLMPGVQKLVLHLRAHKIPIAIATGSTRRHYELKTAHMEEVFGCFDGKVVCGDDSQKYDMKSKPAPDIFLIAARELLGRDVGYGEVGLCSEDERKERVRGLIFEDSMLGVKAGNRAGMSVVWVPDPSLLNIPHSGEEKADHVLNSIEEFIPEEWGLPPYAT